MKNLQISRRHFIQTAIAATGAMVAGVSCSTVPHQARRAAADQVALGRTGLKLSRLGFGTGSNSGNVQRSLGQQEFNRLIRYAYDQGITYFDAAQGYRTHDWIGD